MSCRNKYKILFCCQFVNLINLSSHSQNYPKARSTQLSHQMIKLLQFSGSVANFYLHIPFCIKKCHFCAFPIHALGEGSPNSYKHNMYEQYCKAVLQEIRTMTLKSTLCHQVQSLYFGGGTPSLLPASLIKSLMTQFKAGVTDKTEISLEMNPQQLVKAKQFVKIGVNRFSVGIQSLNTETLALFNRQSLGSISNNLQTSLSYICSAASLNIDFIVDFNHEPEDRKAMMKLIQEVRPHHVSLYVLEVNEGSYLAKSSSKFSHKMGKYEHYASLCNQLQNFGYEHYEVSNFCLPGHRSKHNQAYWQGNKQFGAFGMGATSLLNGYRVTRPKSITKYYKYVQSLAQNNQDIASLLLDVNNENSPKEALKWIILSQLRQREGIEWSKISTEIQKMQPALKWQLKHWKKDCHNELNAIIDSNNQIVDELWIEQGVRMKTPTGFLFTDQVAYRLIQCLNL